MGLGSRYSWAVWAGHAPFGWEPLILRAPVGDRYWVVLGKVSKDFLGFSFILFFLLLVILWMREGQGLCSNSIFVSFVLKNWGNTSYRSFCVLVFERSHLQLHQGQQDVTCGTRHGGRCWFCLRTREGKVLLLQEQRENPTGRGTGGAGEAFGNKVSAAFRRWGRWTKSWSVTREVPLSNLQLRREESPLKNCPGSYPDQADAAPRYIFPSGDPKEGVVWVEAEMK